jgi:hypothetical protein
VLSIEIAQTPKRDSSARSINYLMGVLPNLAKMKLQKAVRSCKYRISGYKKGAKSPFFKQTVLSDVGLDV